MIPRGDFSFENILKDAQTLLREQLDEMDKFKRRQEWYDYSPEQINLLDKLCWLIMFGLDARNLFRAFAV